MGSGEAGREEEGRGTDLGGRGEGERKLRFLPGDRLLPSVSTMCSSANDISLSWPDPLCVGRMRSHVIVM